MRSRSAIWHCRTADRAPAEAGGPATQLRIRCTLRSDLDALLRPDRHPQIQRR